MQGIRLDLCFHHHFQVIVCPDQPGLQPLQEEVDEEGIKKLIV